MNTLLQALRSILGTPDFYIENGNYSSTWDYGAMIEYLCGAIILMIVVSSVFRLIVRVFK